MDKSIDIELNSGSKTILKVGFLIRAFFIFTFVVGSAFLGLNLFIESLILAFVCFAICFVFFLIFYKLLNAAFFKEHLIVTKETITVIHKNLSNTKKLTFNLNEIKYFGFANQHYTKHPMDNSIVDFTGLATQERELQYIIDEGNIKIEDNSKSIKFGKNLPSWDVEELVEKIETFTGQKFSKPQPEILEDILPEDAETEITDEIEEDASQTAYKNHTYKGDFGGLIIQQKDDIPGTGDKAFLNGKLAPTGKYQVGDKQFVLISNGLVYAVRF